ncbi:MAG: phenylalanine--tRNA ligase subunit beta [Oscillospiraceae bacterium]|nr:phenylalanine--tRNA ligase subunit beta [Oscillospiraceae bacterium]
MKVPMSWFSDYTDISGITAKEYAHAVTMTGSKVENIQNPGSDIENVVTAKILSIKPHENSDHLVVCQVDTGDETVQIVTGAPNVKEGQIVPVAKHRSKLPGGVTIKKGSLRGVESCGMMCSHEELGLTAADLGYEPEYGILILPQDTPVGMDIRDYFGLNEDIIEYEITSNRPDCFSVIGLARETAVTFNKPFKVKKPTFTEKGDNIENYISVEVRDDEKCPRYTAKMIKNVKIGPSPKWLVQRLRACGVRSINNIVDITNYVLLEYGQPMHAFDLRDIAGGKIIVRPAAEGEIIKTLDGIDRKLTSETLVISDAEKAVAVAGVMGGFNSEVKPDTQTVIFECATFDAVSVRLAAQRIGLRTEASSRYEKGLDINNVIPAIERACELVELLDCGEVAGGFTDICAEIKPPKNHDFRPDKINAFLGTDITTDEMSDILTRLEFKVDTEKMTVTAPTFRPDIESEADIAEEIARIYGYDNIPTTNVSGAARGKKTFVQLSRDKAMNILTSCGLNEIYTYTFTSPSVFDKLRLAPDSPFRKCVQITNPLGEDTSVMRTTALSGMLEILSHNYNHRNEKAGLFEINKIYIPKADKNELPSEPEMISIGMYGGKIDFYDIKGICEKLFDNLCIENVKYKAVKNNPSFHPGRTAQIVINGNIAGIVGEVHPDTLSNFEIGVPCYAAELNFTEMLKFINPERKYKGLPKFPAVTRDIAMLIDEKVLVADIEEVITSSAGKLLTDIKLFDIYKGKQIPDGKKSVAYSIVFRASDRTLTDEEINKIFDKIINNLEDKLNAELRA